MDGGLSALQPPQMPAWAQAFNQTRLLNTPTHLQSTIRTNRLRGWSRGCRAGGGKIKKKSRVPNVSPREAWRFPAHSPRDSPVECPWCWLVVTQQQRASSAETGRGEEEEGVGGSDVTSVSLLCEQSVLRGCRQKHWRRSPQHAAHVLERRTTSAGIDWASITMAFKCVS